MKRFLSYLMTLVILISVTFSFETHVFAGASINSAAEKYSVSITYGGQVVSVYFTPSESGVYNIYSTSSYDTCGTLYDSYDNQLAYDDDGGEDRNYCIKQKLDAGVRYRISSKLYNSSETGTFDVIVEKTICNHNYSYVYTDPTCTTDGVTTYTCKNCGEVKTVTVARLGHVYISRVTAPTCTQSGYTTHTCSRCGSSYTDSWAQAKGHSWNNGVTTKNPTCTADGVKTYTCRYCSEKRTESISKLGHNYSDRVTEATCTKEGYTAHICSRCSGVNISDRIPAKGHSWEGVVTKKATLSSTGVKTFTCKNCGEKYTETIPKIIDTYKITLAKSVYTYDGRVKTPKVTVKDSKGKKIAANKYTVSYPKGRKNVGQYTVTIKFKGNNKDKIKKSFTIKPKKASFKSVKSTKKGVVEATWSKVSGVSGYYIQYKTNTQNSWKSGNVPKSKNGAAIKKAQSGAKVSIRVRTYKTVKVNGKSQKIYSDWSKTKTVKVK